VIEMTERFNRLSYWVASEIVSTKNSALRLEVLLRFIKVH
jgi:RasGEF domain